uniref:Uncharacterized protein n=1 Tax=Oryza glumipatula TaxID=40148 RepID=A0A0E0B9T5_9ORYZ
MALTGSGTGRARTPPPSSSMAVDLAPAPSTVWPVERRCGEEGQQAGARGRGQRRHRARPAIPIFSPRNAQEGRLPLSVNSQELGESGGGGLPRPPDELSAIAEARPAALPLVGIEAEAGAIAGGDRFHIGVGVQRRGDDGGGQRQRPHRRSWRLWWQRVRGTAARAAPPTAAYARRSRPASQLLPRRPPLALTPLRRQPPLPSHVAVAVAAAAASFSCVVLTGPPPHSLAALQRGRKRERDEEGEKRGREKSWRTDRRGPRGAHADSPATSNKTGLKTARGPQANSFVS